MRPTQKRAWYNLMVVGASLATIITVGLCWNWKGANGGLGLLGFLGLTPLFFRRKSGGGEVVQDERDTLILMRSYLSVYVVCFSVMPLGLVGFAFLYGIDRSIPVVVFPFLALYLFMFATVVEASATLIQYGRGARDDQC